MARHSHQFPDSSPHCHCLQPAVHHRHHYFQTPRSFAFFGPVFGWRSRRFRRTFLSVRARRSCEIWGEGTAAPGGVETGVLYYLGFSCHRTLLLLERVNSLLLFEAHLDHFYQKGFEAHSYPHLSPFIHHFSNFGCVFLHYYSYLTNFA